MDERLIAASGGDSVWLRQGRSIYLKQCATCHVAEPVNDHTALQWAEILPQMSKRSKLTPAQDAAVKAYIDAVLASADQVERVQANP